jgi:hypothetical protein
MLSALGDVEMFPVLSDDTLLSKSINKFIFSRFILLFIPWAAAIRLSANLPTTAHYLFITPAIFIFFVLFIFRTFVFLWLRRVYFCCVLVLLYELLPLIYTLNHKARHILVFYDSPLHFYIALHALYPSTRTIKRPYSPVLDTAIAARSKADTCVFNIGK